MKKLIALTLSVITAGIFFTACGDAGDGDITEGTTESLTKTTTTMEKTDETTTMETGSETTTGDGLIEEGKDNLEEGMDKAESKISDVMD